MNILDSILGFVRMPFAKTKLTPADFRRGKHIKVTEQTRFSVDRNSRHVGTFKGSITPIKRRFKGVSRTANHGS